MRRARRQAVALAGRTAGQANDHRHSVGALMKLVDRGFGWLLAIGAALHAYGSLMFYGPQTVTLVWALSGSLAAALLASLNLMRVNRPADRTLATVCFAGSLAWCAIALAFGVAQQN